MLAGKPFSGFAGDVWALGICLYMFVYGKPPFGGSTTFQIYEAIQTEALAFPSDIKVSSQLQDLLRQLLEKEPAKRMALEGVKAHPWVTQGGLLPALQGSAERAVTRVFEAMRLHGEQRERGRESGWGKGPPPERKSQRTVPPPLQALTHATAKSRTHVLQLKPNVSADS